MAKEYHYDRKSVQIDTYLMFELEREAARKMLDKGERWTVRDLIINAICETYGIKKKEVHIQKAEGKQ